MLFERRKQGTVELVRGNGPIHSDTVVLLSELFDELLEVGQPRVVLDLERVPLFDSEGLELVLDFQDRCLQRGGSLKLAAPNALCRDILTVTAVGSQLEVYSDAVSAVGSFAQ